MVTASKWGALTCNSGSGPLHRMAIPDPRQMPSAGHHLVARLGVDRVEAFSKNGETADYIVPAG